jgi:hypothetical protein
MLMTVTKALRQLLTLPLNTLIVMISPIELLSSLPLHNALLLRDMLEDSLEALDWSSNAVFLVQRHAH